MPLTNPDGALAFRCNERADLNRSPLKYGSIERPLLSPPSHVKRAVVKTDDKNSVAFRHKEFRMNGTVPDALVGSAIERVVPESAAVSPHLVREHIKRYHFAAPRVAGLKVLDAACGSGYGSRILADVAASVVGVDIESDAISYARERYTAPNLSFEIADAHTLDAFADNSFEAVVSFETIEHLPDFRAYVAAVRRVLKPGGIYLVSTPDTKFTDKAKLPAPLPNPYHVHEFEREELFELLATHFDTVQLFGQQFYVEPARFKKALQSAALRLLASPLYQRSRRLVPKALLASGVRMSGIDNENDICAIDERDGIPEILIAICR